MIEIPQHSENLEEYSPVWSDEDLADLTHYSFQLAVAYYPEEDDNVPLGLEHYYRS